jgi:hypothetical protein
VGVGWVLLLCGRYIFQYFVQGYSNSLLKEFF